MRSPFTTCKAKGCGAEIVWLRTARGKACPVLRNRQDGSLVESSTEIFDPRIHHPHWADCPDAPRFKKPQAQVPRPAPPIEDDDKRPGAYQRLRRRPEPPAAPPPILGVTVRPDQAWALGRDGEALILPRRDYCLGRPGQYLAIHDGGAVVAVARYHERTADGEGWVLTDLRRFGLPIPWPPGEGQWELPEALLVKVREAWARKQEPIAIPSDAKTSQPGFPWGDT